MNMCSTMLLKALQMLIHTPLLHAILTFIMCLTATEGKKIVTVCSALFHCMTGCHYSVDWTAGLDYWTGLLDSRKLPLEESEGTANYVQS